MSLDLDAIEALDERMPAGPWDRLGSGSGVWHPPSGHPVPLGDALQFAAEARAMLPALVARVRELEAQLQGLDYRAHPDHYKHNLQRAEEAAAEYLAALEAARGENERLREALSEIRQCLPSAEWANLVDVLSERIEAEADPDGFLEGVCPQCSFSRDLSHFDGGKDAAEAGATVCPTCLCFLTLLQRDPI